MDSITIMSCLSKQRNDVIDVALGDFTENAGVQNAVANLAWASHRTYILKCRRHRAR